MSLPLFGTASHQSPPQAASQTSGHQSPSHAGGQASGHQSPSSTDGVSPPSAHSGYQAENPDGRQDRQFIARFSTATGYVATGLLALTLLIGPINLLLRRRNPISSYLRRDVGTWTAIVSVIHVIAGFFVHGPPAPVGERILYYFFAPDGSLLTNAFGLGNWTGLAATAIVVGLLALSSDFVLRKLKAGPWKWLQRLTYAMFVLVILHAIYYGALLRVTYPSTLLLGLTVVTVFVAQAMGVWLWRRRHSRREAALSQQPN